MVFLLLRRPADIVQRCSSVRPQPAAGSLSNHVDYIGRAMAEIGDFLAQSE
jgi:hypothetical protein